MHGLADGDAGVFGGVVKIDVQIAFRPHRQIHQAVPRQLFHHVIEKSNSGVDVVFAGAVEVHRYLDIGFLGFSGDFCFAHS